MQKENNIQSILTETEKSSVAPPPSWDTMATSVRWQNFFRFGITQINIYTLATFLFISSTGVYLGLSGENEDESKTTVEETTTSSILKTEESKNKIIEQATSHIVQKEETLSRAEQTERLVDYQENKGTSREHEITENINTHNTTAISSPSEDILHTEAGRNAEDAVFGEATTNPQSPPSRQTAPSEITDINQPSHKEDNQSATSNSAESVLETREINDDVENATKSNVPASENSNKHKGKTYIIINE